MDWNAVLQVVAVLLGIVASHFGLKRSQSLLHTKVDTLTSPCPDCGCAPERRVKLKRKK